MPEHWRSPEQDETPATLIPIDTDEDWLNDEALRLKRRVERLEAANTDLRGVCYVLIVLASALAVTACVGAVQR